MGSEGTRHQQSAALRLPKGEAIELASRELGGTAAELSGWRDAFLATGEAPPKARPADGCDARRGLAFRQSCLWPHAGEPRLGHCPRHGLPPAPAGSRTTTAAVRPDRGDGRRDPQPPGREHLPRRRLPQALGQAALQGHPHLQVPCAPPDPRARAAGAASGWPREPRTHDGTIRTDRVDAVEGLRQALHAFKDSCDQGWILERHGCGTPAQVRAEQTALPIAAQRKRDVSKP